MSLEVYKHFSFARKRGQEEVFSLNSHKLLSLSAFSLGGQLL